jgi:hypothetical protein
MVFAVEPRTTDRPVTLGSIELAWAHRVAEIRELHPRTREIDQRVNPDSHLVGAIGELAAARYFGTSLRMTYGGSDGHVDMLVAVQRRGREIQIMRVSVKATTYVTHYDRYMIVPKREVDKAQVFVGVLVHPDLDGRCWLYGYATPGMVKRSEIERFANGECYVVYDRELKRFDRAEPRAEMMALSPLDSEPPVDFLPVVDGVRHHTVVCRCAMCF